MEIPYTDLELLIASITLGNKINKDPELADKMREYSVKHGAELPADTKSINEAVAADNGITVVQLINSPNYQLLMSAYRDKTLRVVIKQMTDELGIAEIEAWAILYMARSNAR